MNLSALDLNLLVVLEALLQERSVTRAGRRVGLSQPATSHALRRLRAELGDPLLVKAAGGLALTPRANQLRPHLEQALRSARSVFSPPVEFDPAAWAGEMRLSLNDYNEVLLLPRLHARVRAEAPALDLRVRPIGAAGRELDENEIDLAAATFALPPPHLRVRVVMREGFCCIVRRDHPVLARGLDLDTYCACEHLLIAPRGDARGLADDVLQSMGRTRRVALTTPHFVVAPHLVAATDLVLTLPTRLAVHMARLLPVTVLPVPLSMAPFSVAIAWHPRTDGDAGQAWFRALWADEAGKLGDGGT